jgi:hypothetical protein
MFALGVKVARGFSVDVMVVVDVVMVVVVVVVLAGGVWVESTMRSAGVDGWLVAVLCRLGNDSGSCRFGCAV